MSSYSIVFIKKKFIKDVFKQAFLKTYKPPPLMFVKFPNRSERFF